MSDVRKGQWWKDSAGQFRVMAVAEGYALVRRRGASPFVLAIKQFAELTRLHLAHKDPTP